MPSHKRKDFGSRWQITLQEIIFEAETPAGKLFDVLLILCILLSVIAVMLDSVSEVRKNYGEFLYDVEGGMWEIRDNQMIFYKSDNVTEVMRFDLYDKSGIPAGDNVYKRKRV